MKFNVRHLGSSSVTNRKSCDCHDYGGGDLEQREFQPSDETFYNNCTISRPRICLFLSLIRLQTNKLKTRTWTRCTMQMSYLNSDLRNLSSITTLIISRKGPPSHQHLDRVEVSVLVIPWTRIKLSRLVAKLFHLGLVRWSNGSAEWQCCEIEYSSQKKKKS